MKTAACLLAVAPSLVFVLASPFEARSAEPGEALVQDAATLTSAEALTWKSDALELQFRDGSRGKRILVLQFAPLAAEKRTDTCHAQVKLLLATLPEVPFSANSSLGDGSFRDVRLQEKDGARTITITRSLESVGRVGKNTQRNLDKFAISFTYEIKDGTLTLTGFPDGPTTWGVTTFTVLQRDIAFQAGK